MILKREKISPSFIENTEINKIYVDGVHTQYEITPCDGFLLHDSRADEEVIDAESLEPTGEIKLRFKTGSVTVRHDYGFDAVRQDLYNGASVESHGKYAFFTVEGEQT